MPKLILTLLGAKTKVKKLSKLRAVGLGRGNLGKAQKRFFYCDIFPNTNVVEKVGERRLWRWWPTIRKGFAKMKHSKSKNRKQ